MPEPEPSLYSVVLLNDDKTPMEFVVRVLQTFFGMDWESAKEKMFFIHHHGAAECGLYEHEVAKKKTADIIAFARKHNHPLQCTFEKARRAGGVAQCPLWVMSGLIQCPGPYTAWLRRIHRLRWYRQR